MRSSAFPGMAFCPNDTDSQWDNSGPQVTLRNVCDTKGRSEISRTEKLNSQTGSGLIIARD